MCYADQIGMIAYYTDQNIHDSEETRTKVEVRSRSVRSASIGRESVGGRRMLEVEDQWRWRSIGGGSVLEVCGTAPTSGVDTNRQEASIAVDVVFRCYK